MVGSVYQVSVWYQVLLCWINQGVMVVLSLLLFIRVVDYSFIISGVCCWNCCLIIEGIIVWMMLIFILLSSVLLSSSVFCG